MNLEKLRMMTRYMRYTVGRWLIHAGLKAFPPGVVRDEVTGALNAWGRHVRDVLAKARQ